MASRWSQALLVGSILLLVGTLAFKWVPPFLAVPPGSQVRCEEPNWDAGGVFSGESYRHSFVVDNTGRTAVTVRSVTASCGCTTYSADIVGRKVNAGERLSIPVTWKVTSQPGKQRKQVSVHFEEWSDWSLPLLVEGQVLAEYTLSSPQLSFGTIATDARTVQEATITFADGAPAGRVTRAECSHAGLTVVLENTTNPREQKIVVQTVPPLATGRLSANILLLTEQGSLVLPVLAAVESPRLESTRRVKGTGVN